MKHHILISGGSGFIGSNTVMYFKQRGFKVSNLSKNVSLKNLSLTDIDVIIHLSGVNKSDNLNVFNEINVDYTTSLVNKALHSERDILFLYASSTQVENQTEYGLSKKKAEVELKKLTRGTKVKLGILRLPNVYGKWSLPYYNSVVATFITQSIENKPHTINDPDKDLELLFINDLLAQISELILKKNFPNYLLIDEFYTNKTTVGTLSNLIEGFRSNLKSGILPQLTDRFTNSLFSTFVSFLPFEELFGEFGLLSNNTGSFAELITTQHSGQVSVLTIAPGATRGDHYHNYKLEKFFVVEGKVKVFFENIKLGDKYNNICEVGETFITRPGDIHKLKNIDDKQAVIVIWANEVYQKDNPDTFKQIDGERLEKS